MSALVPPFQGCPSLLREPRALPWAGDFCTFGAGILPAQAAPHSIAPLRHNDLAARMKMVLVATASSSHRLQMRVVPFKRIVFIVGMLAASLSEAVAAEEGVKIQMPQADVQFVLDFYSSLTGRTVHLDPALRVTVSIQTEKLIPKEEAIQLIRTTLLEKHGVEFWEPTAKDTFVSWSTDPKYKELIKAAKTAAGEPPRREKPPGRQRVRVIR